MNLIVSTDSVREYLELNSPGSTSRYADGTIGSNIRAAQSYLERECHRFFYDHPGITWATTTMIDTQVPVPGFRAITTCTWGGTLMSVAVPGDGNATPSVWALLEPAEGVPDGQRLIAAVQFRPWRTDASGPWWLADPLWFDKSFDSPYYPANMRGGWVTSSMPNDLVIVGDGGYAPGEEPEAVKHVVKVLAAWNTVRPASIMGNIGLTPGGGSIEYGELPPEVYEFVADWKLGRQAVSVG